MLRCTPHTSEPYSMNSLDLLCLSCSYSNIITVAASEEKRAKRKDYFSKMSFAYGIPTTPDHELRLMSNNYAILITPHDEEWSIMVAFASRLVIYVASLALLAMIVALIMKLLGNCDGNNSSSTQPTGARAATETNRLLAKEVAPFTYGTCQEDVESGICNSSSSEDLYDGKICVICYDQQRNCFFIPCGHCATCYICAQRITDGESKTCPVCRRYIHKIRKLFIS